MIADPSGVSFDPIKPRGDPSRDEGGFDTDHASRRQALVIAGLVALDPNYRISQPVRDRLADRVELFRDRLLRHADDLPSGNQGAWIDRLNQLSNRLRGLALPPRRTRHAIIRAPTPSAPGEWHEAIVDDPWDPRTSLDFLIGRATQATKCAFSDPADGSQVRRMLLYAPLYLSNHCINYCLYCPYRYPQATPRRQLTPAEALAQAEILWQRGIRYVLLVCGDFPRLTAIGYLEEIIGALAHRGFFVAIEIAAQSTANYARLWRAGARGVTLYQETYQREAYARCHPRGPKAWFDWRLEAPERAAEAGFRRLGLGVLLGLADPWRDLYGLRAHGQYLAERFPELRLAFSLPRLRGVPAEFQPPHEVDDVTLIHGYCALRLAFPTAELVLSTRERPALRDWLAHICITQMSAGSQTAPGAYGNDTANPEAEQFPLQDVRSTQEIAERLSRFDFHVQWSP